MQRGDVDAVVALLAEDAAFSMPPLRAWFRGREAITVFLAEWPLSGEWRWRHLRTRANGQAAFAHTRGTRSPGATARSRSTC